MSDIITVALIGLIGSGIGSFTGIIVNNKVVDLRLKQLEDKVNKHNNLIERTYKLEEELSVKAEQIKVINHRIDDLEKEKSC